MIVVGNKQKSSQASRLLKLAEEFGISPAYVALEENCSLLSLREVIESSNVIALSIDQFSKSVNISEIDSFIHNKISLSKSLFFYSLTDSLLCVQLLRILTQCKHAQFERLDKAPVNIRWLTSEDCFSKELEGQTTNTNYTGFVMKGIEESNCKTLIEVDGNPTLIKLDIGSFHIYICAGPEFPDLTSRIFTDDEDGELFISAVSFLLFLRHCCPERIWQAAFHQACLIIDDPLLHPDYGFLNYQELESVLEDTGAVSIAFIPWNYNRTATSVAKQFIEFYPQLSIAVHGCNHTGDEFASKDKLRLRFLITEAIRLMHKHKELQELDFEPVIVFPQGKYSTEALEVLSDSELIAGINSTVFPVDMEKGIVLSELFHPAVYGDSSFPVFKRRYPDDLFGSLLDLVYGKPVFLVEHHRFFKEGYDRIQEAFREINSWKQELEWSSPGRIIRSFYQYRKDEDGNLYVRFFSREFTFINTIDSGEIRFITRLPITSIQSVLVNGNSVEYEVEDKTILFKHYSASGVIINISVIVEPHDKDYSFFRQRRSDLVYIAARRHLCEFRDNYVHRSSFLSSFWGEIRKLIK